MWKQCRDAWRMWGVYMLSSEPVNPMAVARYFST